MKKITLINPPQAYTESQFSSLAIIPFGIAYIASYLDLHGYEVKIIDALGENIKRRYKFGTGNFRGLKIEEIIDRIPQDTDLIGISNLYSHAFPIVRRLLERIKIKFPKIPTVVGGIHVTALPEYVMNHSQIDFVILNEGELTMLELIEALKRDRDYSKIDGLVYSDNGKIKINSPRRLIEDLDILPFPKYDALPVENYIRAKQTHGPPGKRSLPMIATRGCSYSCRFCTAPLMWQKKFRTRSPKNVVDEMEFLINKYDVTDIQFEDLILAYDRNWVEKFCNEIIKRRLKISWQIPNGTRCEPLDDEILYLMKKSGLKFISLAPETGSQKVLQIMRKELNLENINSVAKRIVRNKLIVCCNFLIGIPGETLDDVKETFHYIRKLAIMGVDDIAITTFSAIPGNEIFYDLLKKKRINLTDEFFTSLLCQADLTRAASWSKQLTNGQITRLRIIGYLQFYLFSFLFHPKKLFGILKRFIFNIDVKKTKFERFIYNKLIG